MAPVPVTRAERYTMLCHIYRSNRKHDTYLYLVDKDDFSTVPAELLRVFGAPEFSFSFELTRSRRLAREDAAEVLDNLQNQ
ncbi:MAG TPA: YcgL domain-containing protein, partial [Gammaproteobacteria bacterium]|nr:YcgL domain-containing protein [Gammaproteobacteria bacterium]